MYCKPTHTDQYLEWDSHHNLSAKYSVIGILTHGAKTVCTGPELFQKEIQYLREVWASASILGGPYIRFKENILTATERIIATTTVTRKDSPTQSTHSPSRNTEGSPQGKKPSIGQIVILYTQGLGESLKKICGKYGIHTHFNGNRTLRQLLVKPKDQDLKEKKNGVICGYQHGEIACNEEYIGETSRTLGRDTGST